MKSANYSKGGETNKLKQMKKFYPEEYFKRSGYPFKSLSQQKKDMIYFKNKIKQH